MDPFNSMVTYCRRVLMLGFLISSITWVPQVYHSLTLFFSVSLPNIISAAVTPKCLFVVSNLIVIFLYGESKLGKCTKKNERDSSVATIEKVEYLGVESNMLMYANPIESNVRIIQDNKEVEEEEVVEEKQIVEIVTKMEETTVPDDGDDQEGEKVHEEMVTKRDEETMSYEHKEIEREQKDAEVRGDEDVMEIEHGHDKIEREDDEKIMRLEEEIEPWAAEELNRKVEDFIAKFNMQIRLEARMAISCY